MAVDVNRPDVSEQLLQQSYRQVTKGKKSDLEKEKGAKRV